MWMYLLGQEVIEKVMLETARQSQQKQARNPWVCEKTGRSGGLGAGGRKATLGGVSEGTSGLHGLASEQAPRRHAGPHLSAVRGPCASWHRADRPGRPR